MISLIKQFKDKCEQEYQAYFEATKITTDMSHGEMLLKMEQTKDLKMPDHREEEKEFYKNLNYEQWLNEIKFDVKALTTYAIELNRFGTILTQEELSLLAIHSFEQYGAVNIDTLNYMNSEYVATNDILRDIIINGNCIDAISKLDNLTDEEKLSALENRPRSAINHIINLTDSKEEILEFIKLYICLGGEFDKINDWKDYINSELISLIIAMSDYMPEFINELLNTHPEYNMTHIYALIKKKPTSVSILHYVESDFGDIYLKTQANPEKEYDLLVESYESMKEKHHEYSVLFKEVYYYHKPIVSLENYIKSYKELYI